MGHGLESLTASGVVRIVVGRVVRRLAERFIHVDLRARLKDLLGGITQKRAGRTGHNRHQGRCRGHHGHVLQWMCVLLAELSLGVSGQRYSSTADPETAWIGCRSICAFDVLNQRVWLGEVPDCAPDPFAVPQ